MNFRRIFITFSFIIGFFLVLPELITFNFVKPIVLPIAEGALGRGVRINGNIHLRLVPYLRLIVDGLEIDNVKGAARDKFATVDSMILTVDLAPLLWGKIVLNARITNPKVNLEIFDNDKNNWSFGETFEKQQEELRPKNEAKDPNKFAGWFVKVENLKIGDAIIEVKDRKVTKVYELATVGLGANSLTGPFFINGRLYHDYSKYDFSLRATRFMGDSPSHILLRFREAGDFFSTLFRGDITLKPLAVKGYFEGRASMRKLNIDGLLLKNLSIRPVSHLMLLGDVTAKENQVNMSKLQLKLPLTTVSGQASMNTSKAIDIAAHLTAADGGSFLKVDHANHSHKFDLKIANMGKLLKLYKFDTPTPPDTPLTYSGNLLWQGGSYTLQAEPLSIAQAQAEANFQLFPQKNKTFKLSAGVHFGDIASWRTLLNVKFLPGLDRLTTKLLAEGSQDNLKFDLQTNFDDSGVLESKGTLIQQDILKAKASLRYKDARDLAYDMNARNIPEMGPFNITCDIHGKGNITEIDNLVFDTKPIQGKGKVRMESKGEKQNIDVTMDWDSLDLWSLINFQFADEKPKKGEKQPVVVAASGGWPKEPIAWPSNLSVSMDVRVKDVSFFQPIIQDARLNMLIKPDMNLSLRGKSALTKKDCTFSLSLEPGKYRHTIKTEASLNQIPVFPFMQLLTTAVSFGGGITSKMSLSTKGLSVEEMMRSLSGSIMVQADGAFIQGYNLRQLSRNPSSIGGMLMNTLFRKQAEGKGLGLFDVKEEKNQSTPIRTLKADVRVSSGNAEFRAIELDAEGVYGKSDGQLNLGKRTIDMRGTMVFPEIKLKDVPSLMFTLVGSLDNMKFDSNVDKFVDYFISNVLASLISKTLGSLLLNAIVPGLGVVANAVVGAVSDASAAADNQPPEDNSAKIKALQLPARLHQSKAKGNARVHAN